MAAAQSKRYAGGATKQRSQGLHPMVLEQRPR
jgi:hypothetical protein